MNKDEKKKESKAEAAESFGKKKTEYVERVYNFKDGPSCRVREPKVNNDP